jgi:hypothetical protein
MGGSPSHSRNGLTPGVIGVSLPGTLSSEDLQVESPNSSLHRSLQSTISYDSPARDRLPNRFR